MYRDIIDFWFTEMEPGAWTRKIPELDEQMRRRFAEVHRQAAQGELWHWRKTDLGRLAEVIVLDQFSRNMWRDTPDAFAADSIALVLAQEAIAGGVDQRLPVEQRLFLYMPFMHSESLSIHERALRRVWSRTWGMSTGIGIYCYASVAIRTATLFSGGLLPRRSWNFCANPALRSEQAGTDY